LLKRVTGIAASEQRLIFSGHQLKDARRLSDYHIKKDDTLQMVVSLVGGGKRGRGGKATEFDKQAVLSGMQADFQMKARSLVGNDLAFVAELSRDMMQRRNHDQWFVDTITAMPLEELKQMRDQISLVHTANQRTRILGKFFFNGVFARITSAEQALKVVKGMGDGMIDQYMTYVVSARYMQDDGVVTWAPFMKQLDDLVTNRIAEAAVAHAIAAAPAPVVAKAAAKAPAAAPAAAPAGGVPMEF
jgi:hypothetical protein